MKRYLCFLVLILILTAAPNFASGEERMIVTVKVAFQMEDTSDFSGVLGTLFHGIPQVPDVSFFGIIISLVSTGFVIWFARKSKMGKIPLVLLTLIVFSGTSIAWEYLGCGVSNAKGVALIPGMNLVDGEYYTVTGQKNGWQDAYRCVQFREKDIVGGIWNFGIIIMNAVPPTPTPTPSNHPPTDILLSNTSIQENPVMGALIGTLSAVDPDPGDTFTYSFVVNPYDAFMITGNELRVANPAVFDHETNPNLIPRIRVTDSGGLSFEKGRTPTPEVTPTPTPTGKKKGVHKKKK